MKKRHLLRIAVIIVLSCSSNWASAQGMAINTSGSTADGSAMLDVSSTSKGMLVPRMTNAQIGAISNPATSLLVYQTDGTAGFYYNSGTPGSPTWTAVTTPASSGGVIAYADFYALMPPDNTSTVAVGGDVQFPQTAAQSVGITNPTSSTFVLAGIGVYQVMFQVSVDEPGQLELTLNGAALAYTVVGRSTGTSQITGTYLVPTTSANSVLTVRNPAGNATALTITPLAGGASAVSAHLVITRIQ